jgi:hypothetical protein
MSETDPLHDPNHKTVYFNISILGWCVVQLVKVTPISGTERGYHHQHKIGGILFLRSVKF